jgi:hypothetical protein
MSTAEEHQHTRIEEHGRRLEHWRREFAQFADEATAEEPLQFNLDVPVPTQSCTEGWELLEAKLHYLEHRRR